MEIPKCLDCKTIKKDPRSKRCFPCRTAYFRSKEWAETPEEIERRRKISINNGKSNLGGKNLTKEVREKIGLSHKGNTYRLGKTHSKIARFKISQANLGKKYTEESKRKMSEAHKGEKNYLWKGDKVGYSGLHIWVRHWLGQPDTCEFCGKNDLSGQQIHWANKSHQYKRELTDWLRLCAKCHKVYDQDKLVFV